MAIFYIAISTFMFVLGCFTAGNEILTAMPFLAAAFFAYQAGAERGERVGEVLGRSKERIELMTKKEAKGHFLHKEKK